VRFAACLWALAVLASCGPRTVLEAEKRGDIAWLTKEGSPEAVAALGRLGDSDSRAVQAVEARADADVNAFIAAWAATQRGSAWGPAAIRSGLANPARADVTASVMTRKDPHVDAFVPELASALQRLAASRDNTAIAGVLASAGAAGDPVVARRLEDGATRAAMCRGIGSPDSSDNARRVFMSVSVNGRDHESCVETALSLAKDDDAAMNWLAQNAEPGLLSAAGARQEFPCSRLSLVWTKALASRPGTSGTGLTVPLHHALARCGRALDPVLAAALTQQPSAYELIVAGIDPFGTETSDLPQTCAALKPHYASRGNAFTRERARAAVTHGCVFAK
jgi:hypothetical protein